MAGGDAFSLQKILGRSTLDVTRNYINMLEGQVTEKHRRFSPMDNLELTEGRVAKKPAKPGKKLWAVK